MATRSSARGFSSDSASPAPSRIPLVFAQPASSASPQLLELRRHWKWAAFSQFYYTFARLVASEDISLVDVEEDLVNGTMVVIPRIMQRLLVTLTQDRKTTVDSWQSTLRRQYLRRDPQANPIGVEPVVSRHSRAVSEDIAPKPEDSDEKYDEALSQDENVFNSTKEQLGHDVVQSEEKRSVIEGESESKEQANLEESTKSELDDAPPLKDWSELDMLVKLDSIHSVMEWHFQNPVRVRQTMRSDDETASWRIEPIGYDAKHNAYWFIGTDRLWIQRATPKPPRKATKRKAPETASSRKKKAAKVNGQSTKQSKASLEIGAKKETPRRVVASGRTRSSRGSKQEEPTSSPSRSRAAKTQANAKLDEQAKELAATRKELLALSRSSANRSSPTKPQVSYQSPRAVGTRLSSRLRGRVGEEEWQPIPDEWLNGDEKVDEEYLAPTTRRRSTRSISPRKSTRIAVQKVESSEESDLTDLSDLEDKGVDEEDEGGEEAGEAEPEIEPQQEEAATEPSLPEDFVEWETICVSLLEWQTIADRWAKATHYLEKALYKVLVNEIVPYVTENLKEIEKQRQKEESLMNRKRSSRLQVKEVEKESARMAVIKQAEDEERHARLRRLEARTKKEEEERLQKEQAREQRRKEREERELARSRKREEELEAEITSESLSRDTSAPLESHPVRAPPDKRAKKSTKKVAEESDIWELDCEVCGSKGINRDDGLPLMSCGKCSRWQHIPCHDAKNKKEGRSARNWDKVDFTCKRCTPESKLKTRPPKPQSSGYSTVGAAAASPGVRPVNRQPTSNQNFAGFAHYAPQQGAAYPYQPQAQYPHYPQPQGVALPYAQMGSSNPRNQLHTILNDSPRPQPISHQASTPVHHVPHTQIQNTPSPHPIPNYPPHVPYQHQVAQVPIAPRPAMSPGPQYPHSVFHQQPAYGGHTTYRSQV